MNMCVEYYTDSPSLSGLWKDLKPMLRANSHDDKVDDQKYKSMRAEIHNLSGFRYHNIDISLVGMLHVTGPRAPEHEMPVDGPIDAQLVYSRNDINWHHFDSGRTPIIIRGASSAFDNSMI